MHGGEDFAGSPFEVVEAQPSYCIEFFERRSDGAAQQRDRAAQMRALALTRTNSEVAGLMNDLAL